MAVVLSVLRGGVKTRREIAIVPLQAKAKPQLGNLEYGEL